MFAARTAMMHTPLRPAEVPDRAHPLVPEQVDLLIAQRDAVVEGRVVDPAGLVPSSSALR